MIRDDKKFKRDLRIDFLRGMALLTIFIDHVPQNRWAAVTQQNFGFSDAAETFVALAGFSAVLAYGRYFDRGDVRQGVARIASRIGSIYIYHLATLALVAAMLAVVARTMQNPDLLHTMSFEAIVGGDWAALIGAATLYDQPTYFDVLPLYTVLLALFPFLYLVMRRSIPLGLTLSGSLWLLVQIVPGLNLPTAEGTWYFNPFAWQFLLALGAASALSVQRGGLIASRGLVALATGVLLAALIARAPWAKWPLYLGEAPLDLKPYATSLHKTSLGALRLVHFVAFGYLLLVLVPPRAAWLKTVAARTIADTGRSSLEIFCLGVVLSVIGGSLIVATGRGAVVESWVTTSGVAALLLVGTYLARQLRERKAARKRLRGGTRVVAASRLHDRSRRQLSARSTLNSP